MKRLIAPTTTSRALDPAVRIALLAALMTAPTLPASAQSFLYRGSSTAYPNIKMELTITPGAADATGGIYLGNYNYSVKGTFSGGVLNATAAYNGAVAGTAIRVPVKGSLVGGALGTGSIGVQTGGVAFGGGNPVFLTFVLAPVGGSNLTLQGSSNDLRQPDQALSPPAYANGHRHASAW